MAAETVLTVTKLNEYVSGILSNEPRLRSVRVSGEISGFKRHSSGHLYFNLKDQGAVIACVMFRSDAAKLRIDPKDGMQVVARGSVNVYVRDGKYQLYVAGMQPSGEGELYRSFLLLKDKLAKEGLFDNDRELPMLPRCIGIATSDTGAALRDMLNVIKRRFPKMNVLFAPCKVQGEDAPREIVAALRALQRFDKCEVIIVGRGGGSYEDLYCFNDESVARAIAASSVPVVSAVGHETDFTIADFAADLRAPTPSAAAELCCPVYEDIAWQSRELAARAERLASERLFAEKRSIAGLMGSAAMANPRHALGLKAHKLVSVLQRCEGTASSALQRRRAELASLMERLNGASPSAIMARGYAMVSDERGRPVSAAAQLKKGSRVSIAFSDGKAIAGIEEVSSND